MWIICSGNTPGPTEPTTEQLVHVMESDIHEISLLKEGIDMEMYDENNENIVIETVRADVTCTNCDTPSARKLGGHAGHSHDLHCCPWCHCTLLDVNRPAGYYSEVRDLGFILRNDYDMLKQKLYAKDALFPRQSAILKNHGISCTACS
ncbi:hypothetical protein F5877DRAFT_87069 [Lentinula edodes]|nr:hypothetical protein F5877DRAFT_87069 [Lentinula edodes]